MSRNWMNHEYCECCGQKATDDILVSNSDGKYYLQSLFARQLADPAHEVHELYNGKVLWLCGDCKEVIENDFRDSIQRLKVSMANS